MHKQALERSKSQIHTLKETPSILLIQSQKLSGSLADLGQSKLHPPDFSLIPEPILACKANITIKFVFLFQNKKSLRIDLMFTNEFQLLVETWLLEGTSGGDISLATNPTPGNGHGDLTPKNWKQFKLLTWYSSFDSMRTTFLQNTV